MSDQLIYSTRREFLQGTLGMLSISSTIPQFLCQTATILADEPKKSDGRILIVLQLAGGNDGLNTVVPHVMDAYYQARPTLAIASSECLKLNDQLGLHPALSGLKEIYDQGHLAVIQGVGYPNPNRSHFKSMDIWHTANPTGRTYTGWLGRYFDSCCQGSDPPKPHSALALMGEMPLALSGDRFTPIVFESPDDLAWRDKKGGESARRVFEKLNAGVVAPANPKDANKTLDFLRRASLEARLGAADLQEAISVKGEGKEKGKGKISNRPNNLQRQLEIVSRMVAGDFPTSVYYVSFGGFDTHSGQEGRHRQLMAELGDALKWFVSDLKNKKLLQRVLIVSFSEFGRRVSENASGGTDHGAAAPLFVIGEQVKPGVHLEHPSLQDLDEGDLKFQCDFRRIYATVLRDWLKVNPEKILGGQFPPLPLLQKK